jgi:uncharacterized RDD family membrane protein YckC
LNANSSPFDSETQIYSNQAPRLIGPVWRRLAAYVLDSFLLAIVGTGLGVCTFERLSLLGLWGRIVGFCIALAYFASLDGTIGNGQTAGKRLLKLRVIDARGDTIPFAKCFLRSAIFLAPSFLVGLRLPQARTPWIVSSLIFVIVLWVGGSTLYLITFNHQTRQGLHDLAVGSYVGICDDAGPINAEAVHDAQWMALGTLLMAVSVAAAILNVKLEKMSPLPEMRQDAALIEQLGGVQRARLRDVLLHSSAGGGASKTLLVSVTLRSKSLDQEVFAEQVARIIFQNDAHAQNYDELSVRLFYGYDIGIAQRWNHDEYTHTPTEWQRLLSGSPPASVQR